MARHVRPEGTSALIPEMALFAVLLRAKRSLDATVKPVCQVAYSLDVLVFWRARAGLFTHGVVLLILVQVFPAMGFISLHVAF